MSENKEKKKLWIIPFSMGESIHGLLNKRRFITGVPTVEYLKRLILKDSEEDPKSFGL